MHCTRTRMPIHRIISLLRCLLVFLDIRQRDPETRNLPSTYRDIQRDRHNQRRSEPTYPSPQCYLRLRPRKVGGRSDGEFLR